jgi:DNA-directed RNA polymerase subunit RPC12/RpoP
MPPTELPESRDRRCPACESEELTFANHVLAVGGAIKEEYRCTTCGTAFWFVRKPLKTFI